MAFDALVLSGGRGLRLGGVPKATMLFEGSSLIRHAVDAAAGARKIVVVGDGVAGLPAEVIVIREEPAYSGPAAAIGAGMTELATGSDPAQLVLVLACDMPGVRLAISKLFAAAASDPELHGVMAIDEFGRSQYLAAVYRTAPLVAALAGRDLCGLSMRAVTDELRMGEVSVPIGATADVDSWDDARRLGVTPATIDIDIETRKRA
ncbi:MAG: NTP transferase domain-containing protein [Pseudolysinimonas sp.]